jgi:hypothetical protein
LKSLAAHSLGVMPNAKKTIVTESNLDNKKTMNKKAIWTIWILFILVSCKKEKFPDKDDLKGTWIEQTDNSFKHKLIFEEEIVYFIKSTSVDTLSYRLDKKQDFIFLTLKYNPSSGESNHKISLTKKNKTLRIWGLFGSIPEQITETKFLKE